MMLSYNNDFFSSWWLLDPIINVIYTPDTILGTEYISEEKMSSALLSRPTFSKRHNIKKIGFILYASDLFVSIEQYHDRDSRFQFRWETDRRSILSLSFSFAFGGCTLFGCTWSRALTRACPGRVYWNNYKYSSHWVINALFFGIFFSMWCLLD